MQVNKILAMKMNPNKDLKLGDTITLLYEKEHHSAGVSQTKRVIFAKLDSKKYSFEASRFKDKFGHVAYYDSRGRSLGTGYLRYPVKFERISSPFNMHRLHPVLKKVRPHTGVDLAARSGTPVKSVSSGYVRFVGHKGGYGKVVIIKHNAMNQTLYAHLSKFPKHLKVGQKVKMSQVIGYVGMSGLATGPHLHYEFRVKGRPVNPLKIRLPRKKILAKNDLKRFRTQHRHWIAALKGMIAS